MNRNRILSIITVFTLTYANRVVAQVKPNTDEFPAATTQTVKTVPFAYGGGIPLNYVRTWVGQKPLATASEIISGSRTLQEVQMVTQYVDGLGRPIQTVAKGASPAGYDMVTPVLYDEYGRVTFSYLPYTSTGTNGSFKTNPFSEQATFMQGMYNPTSNANGEKFFYSRTAYEPSPLNRIDTALAAGNSWVGRLNGMLTQYKVNVTADSVRLWTIGSSVGAIPATSQVYGEAQLVKLITTDEHGKQVIEFKNRKGQVILTKVQIAANVPSTPYVGWLCTYYIYDDWDNLRYVIQPVGVELTRANSWSITAAIAKEMCFAYEYDVKKRLISKRVPGTGEVWMVYDKRNRLIMTQDSLLRVKGKWLYNRYDSLNRQIVNGLWSTSGDRSFHQLRGDTSIIYPNPTSNNEVLTETYYDNYNWVSGSGSGLSSTLITTYTSNTNYFYTPSNSHPYPQAIATAKVTNGFVTGTKVKVLGTATYLYSVSFYDDRGKVIQIHSTNISNAKDTITNQYDFSGKLLRSLVCHTKSTPNAQRYLVLTKMEYDAQGRVTKVSKKTGNSPEVVLSESSYDETGQVQKKKLGRKRDETSQNTYSNSAIDSLQYTYNIKGWIRGINKDYARATSSNNYFGMELAYDFGFTQTQLNGNIAGIRWRSKGDGEQRAYGFTYDAANRFAKGDFTQYSSSAWNTSAGIDFTVKDMSYDANGNILSMTQKGIKLNTSSVIDSLAYGYMSSNTTNRLLYVTDKTNDSTSKLGDFKEYANNTTQDYWYDGNGNLTKDNNKRINTITYNHLNLPDTIHVLGKGRILYTYNAAGTKLKKQTVDSTVNPVKTTTTLYLDEFIYENDTLQFVSNEEGRSRPKRANYSDTLYYDYFVKDHLGNVRMVLSDEIQRDQYPSATFEAASLATEQLYYEKVNEQRVVRPGGFSGNSSDTVQLLRKNVQSIGVGKLLKVMATDSLHITVQYYTPNVTTDNANANGLNSVIAALLPLLNSASAPPPVHGNGTAIANALNSSADFTSFLSPQAGSGGTNPKAYLNILFFDEQFKFVQQNSEIVQVSNKGSGQTISRVNATAKIAPKNGYAYIYVSNESNNLVYFDNLQITHRRGPILEETHYYPFGLTMKGISGKSLGKLDNDKKYNGIDFENDLDINTYDAYFRDLDPQTGRWWQIDPKIESMEMWSPYASNYDNPISYSDPLGDEGEQCCKGFLDIMKRATKGAFGGAAATIIGTIDNVTGTNIRGSVAASEIIQDPDIAQGWNMGLGAADAAGIAGGGAESTAGGTLFATSVTVTGATGALSVEITGPTAIAGGAMFFHGGYVMSNASANLISNNGRVQVKSKIEERGEKLSKKQRPGQDFTKAGKENVKDANKEQHSGTMQCANCNTEVQNGQQHQTGVTPPANEAHVDHKKPKSKGGSGTPDNGQVLCRDCNIKKSNN